MPFLIGAFLLNDSAKIRLFSDTAKFRVTGKPWKSREVVVESVQNALHPDQYVARLFGEAVDKFTAQEGEVIGIELRHSVREYNGRYYGEASIVDFEQVQPF